MPMLHVHSAGAPEYEWHVPALVKRFQAAARSIRGALISRPGIAAAWLAPCLIDERASGEPMVLALCDQGWEFAEAIELQPTSSDGRAESLMLAVAALSREAMEDALAVDSELAILLARGFRICGSPRETLELESMARAITGSD